MRLASKVRRCAIGTVFSAPAAAPAFAAVVFVAAASVVLAYDVGKVCFQALKCLSQIHREDFGGRFRQRAPGRFQAAGVAQGDARCCMLSDS